MYLVKLCQNQLLKMMARRAKCNHMLEILENKIFQNIFSAKWLYVELVYNAIKRR